MLNLQVAMNTKYCLLLLAAATILCVGFQIESSELPRIISPQPGSALQGSVPITGFTDLPGFQSAEVSFSYSEQPDQWFLIEQAQTPVQEGLLAIWDTTVIADGTYRLRLQVVANGKNLDANVTGLRVRNYRPIETNTPSGKSLTPQVTLSPTPEQPTPTIMSTPTALPSNPAMLKPSDLTTGVGVGVGITIFIFIILAVYRSATRREAP